MAHKKTTQPTKTEKDKLFDALFGPDEEMDEQCAEELLGAFDIGGQELVREFQQRIETEAQKIRLQGGNVPDTMRNVIQSLRSGGAFSDTEIKNVEPTAWVNALLTGKLSTSREFQVRFAYRQQGKEELSSKDKKLIDSLKAEVEAKGKP